MKFKEKHMKAIVTVVGKDRVGIIGNVCMSLASFNVNVLDISQTVMQGYLTMMMAVDVSACSIPVADLVTEAVINNLSEGVAYLKWSSSDSDIVTVTSKGVVTAENEGTAKIYVTYLGKKYTTKVTVENSHVCVFEKAEGAGVEYMLVEQDDCYGEDPIACLARSYNNLHALGFN